MSTEGPGLDPRRLVWLAQDFLEDHDVLHAVVLTVVFCLVAMGLATVFAVLRTL